MGFEPKQHPSGLETVNKFTEQIKTAIEKAKAVVWKTQKNIMWYYNQRKSLAPVFHPRDQVFLDTTNIKTHIHPQSCHTTVLDPL